MIKKRVQDLLRGKWEGPDLKQHIHKRMFNMRSNLLPGGQSRNQGLILLPFFFFFFMHFLLWQMSASTGNKSMEI